MLAARTLAFTLAAVAPAYAQQGSSAAVGSFDILGVRLGMTVAQARDGVKAHRLLNYTEGPSALVFNDPVKGQQTTVPNGQFVSELETDSAVPWSGADQGRRYWDKAGGKLEYLEVMFSPEPSHEKVVKVVHAVMFDVEKGKGIREADLIKGFEEKYGVTLTPDMEQHIRVLHEAAAWSTSPSGPPSPAKGPLCKTPSFLFPEAAFGPDPWAQNGFSSTAQRQNEALRADRSTLARFATECGAEIVGIGWDLANPGAPPDQRIVLQYYVSVYSAPLALESIKVAAQLTTAAKNANGQSNAAQAAKQKPSF